MQNLDAMTLPRLPVGQEVISPEHGCPAGRRCDSSAPALAAGDATSQQPPPHTLAAVQRILVPTDFSPPSAMALDRALRLACLSDASITLLHIVDLNAQHPADNCGPAQEFMTQLWSEGMARVEEVARALPARVRAQTVVAEGLPWEEIAEKSAGFDLVVMGQRRARRRWNPFARHTVQRAVENARCPVMIVPA